MPQLINPNLVLNPGRLKYMTGDATQPHGAGHQLIIHICNLEGKWGAGFVLSLSKRWKQPEQQYRLWYRSQGTSQQKFQLGEIQTVEVQSEIAVVNMLAQRYVGVNNNGELPLSLEALDKCLIKVAKEAKERNSSIHAPRLGAGLAAGSKSGYSVEVWTKVEELLIKRLTTQGINVTIYDLPKQ